MLRRQDCLTKRFSGRGSNANAMKKRSIDNDIFFREVERLLAEGDSVTIRVRGNSMRPLLRDGRDRIILRQFTDEDVRRGAVMLFRYRGMYCIHRIKRIEGDTIVFAGDGNYRIEEQVSRCDLKAVMRAVLLPNDTIVECDSLRWRVPSKLWLILPQIARRLILGVLRRLFN